MLKPNPDADLVVLDQQLLPLRRRARRLQHGMQQGTAQWSAWSGTVDEGLGLVDRMMSVSAAGLPGLAIKIGAVVWFLQQTDAILDGKGLRQLRSLEREARRMARM